MSYRFKEPGHGMGPHSGPDSMRPMGPNDSKFDDGRMMGGMDSDKLSRDDMEGEPGRGPRPPFGRGRRLSPPRDKSLDRQRDFGYGRDDMPPHVRDRSPIRGGFDDRFPDRFKRDEMPFPRREEHGRKDRFGDDMYREKFMGGMESRGRFDGPAGPAGLNSRFDLPEDPLRHRPLHYPNIPYKGYYKSDMMKPNECEIIVVNKHQRAYAENVEQRLKNLGIQVDILFLKDEALLVQTIDDIARRGSLYAVVITPLNETHRSVTLNILYGTPQEHRNMPLDDALKLVARNFHDHIRSQRELMDRDRSERGVYSGSFPADREIQFLLRLLADGRQVSLGEIETVLRYLTERRDKMKGVTGDRGPATSLPLGSVDVKLPPQNKPKDENEIAQKEQDLQNRIMNIISQGEATGDVDMGGPNKSSSGSNVPGLGPDGPGSRPNMPPSGPNLRGVSPNHPPMGASPLGADQNRPGMGINRSGMNQNLPGLGQNQSSLSPLPSNANPNQAGNPPVSGNIPNSASNPASTSASTYINFDNPSVKKALDSLMQSGPNLLKSLSGTTPPSSQGMQNNANNKMSPGMGPPRGPGGMGEMGPQRGGMGDMGQQRGPGDMGMRDVGPGGDMGQKRGPGGMGDMGPPRGMGGDMGPQRGPGGMGDMGPQRGPGGMGDMGPQRGPGGMGPQRGPGGMGDMGPRGPGGMGDMGPRGPGGMSDMGPQRGPGGIGDMGPRGPGGLGDMGPQRGPGGMSDMGPQRGPGGMGDMGPQRGPGGMGDMGPRGMGDMGPRGPGGMGDMGPRRPGGMGDMGPRGMGDMGPRGPGNMEDMGSQRGLGGMGNMEGQRGVGGGMGSGNNMGMQRGLGGMDDRNMLPGMGHSQDSGNMGPPQGMSGRPGMGLGPRSGGMGVGSQFPGPQGMYGSGPNMMGNRPPYMGGHMGNQGMGGGPRRY